MIAGKQASQWNWFSVESAPTAEVLDDPDEMVVKIPSM